MTWIHRRLQKFCRNNLRLLLREAGGTERIAKELKTGRRELESIASLNNQCRIGSWLARDIENRLGIETDWLDMSHDYLPHEARSLARKWLILPASLQDQVRDYINLQIHLLRFELKTHQNENTNFKKFINNNPVGKDKIFYSLLVIIRRSHGCVR